VSSLNPFASTHQKTETSSEKTVNSKSSPRQLLPKAGLPIDRSASTGDIEKFK
jgi:hypothetical protein